MRREVVAVAGAAIGVLAVAGLVWTTLSYAVSAIQTVLPVLP